MSSYNGIFGSVLLVEFHKVASVLGLIFFLIVVNDLPEMVSSMLYVCGQY